MNYIKRLKQENEERQNQINSATKELNSLVSYLCSSKFYNDPTVQTQDVLNRLDNVKRELFILNTI